MSIEKKITSILEENIIISIERIITLKLISIKISNKCIYIKIPFLLTHKTLEQLIHKKKIG